MEYINKYNEPKTIKNILRIDRLDRHRQLQSKIKQCNKARNNLNIEIHSCEVKCYKFCSVNEKAVLKNIKGKIAGL